MFLLVIVKRRNRRKAGRKVQRSRLLILRKVVSLALKKVNQRRSRTTMVSASLTNPASHYHHSTNHLNTLLNLQNNPNKSTQLSSTKVYLSLLRNLQSHKDVLLRDRPPVTHNFLRQPLPPLQPPQARTLTPLRAHLPPLQPPRPFLSLEMIFLPISFICDYNQMLKGQNSTELPVKLLSKDKKLN